MAGGAPAGLHAVRVRQHDRVHLGVRQIESAAEHVTELMVQRHADRAARRAGEPGAVQRLGARLGVLGLAHHDRQARRQRADALLGDQRGERIAVRRIERLDAVRDRVHPGRPETAAGSVKVSSGS